MGSVTKTNDVERPEFVLYYHPCDANLFESFLAQAGSDLKEIIFQSWDDFKRIDPRVLPADTGLKLRDSITRFSDHRKELQSLFPERRIFFLVEVDFALLAADPKTYLAPLLATSTETEEIFSILVRRTQYAEFMATKDVINAAFACPVDFTLEFFEPGLELKAGFEDWKARIAAETTQDHFTAMTLPFYNKTHNFFRRRNLFIRGPHLYLSPQVYDNLELRAPGLEVTGLTPAQIHRRAEAIQAEQLQSAHLMQDCADCKNLIFCAGRLTLAALRELQLTACPFPEVVVRNINRE